MPGFSSKTLKLTDEHKQVLKETVINESGPGTILRDVNMLLRFVGEREIPVTGTHQLPIGALPDVNARMTHPLQQALKSARNNRTRKPGSTSRRAK